MFAVRYRWRLGLALMLWASAIAGCDDGGGGNAGESDLAADVGTTDLGADMAAPMGCAQDPECPANQYCVRTEGAFEGRCEVGCRLDDATSCPARTLCDAETRTCESDGRCIGDEECPSESWCNAGDCVPGCRVVEPDRCPPGDGGAPQQCNPADRTCTPLVPCCDEGCTLSLPAACADRPDAAFTRCVNPDPCAGRCANDASCGEGEYCAANGLCAEGCNPDNPSHCEGQLCDRDTHQCVGRSCDADTECFADEYCDGAARSCRVGCRTGPDNCRNGLFCTAARQCGAGCLGDAACVQRNGAGWICVFGECIGPCTGDTDCEADEVCVPPAGADPEAPLRGQCETGCRDDAQEGAGGNDDQLSARPLNFGADPRALDLADLRACPRDGDWYRFDTVRPGVRVDVTVRFAHAEGDLDAMLYVPPSGGVAGPVVRAQSADDDEVLSASGPAGTWYVYVFARAFDRNDYTLSVRLTDPVAGVCAEDAAEGPGAVGADDAPAGATFVALPALQETAEVAGRSICEGDEDWFAVDLGDGDGFTARLNQLGNGTGMDEELDLAIFGPGAPAPGAVPDYVVNGAGGGMNGPRYVEFSAPRDNPQVRAGRHYIRVSGLDAAQNADYTLTLSVARLRIICLPDAGEPDNALGNAYDMEARADLTVASPVGRVLRPGIDLTVSPRSLCSGDEDWYRLRTANGDDLTVSLLRDEVPVVGDSIIEIRNAGGIVGSAGRNAQARNVARAIDLPAAVHYVRIVGATDRVESQYRLVFYREAEVLPCVPDAFEAGGGNDVRERATALPALGAPDASGVRRASLNGSELCGREGDVDWFAFDTPAFGDVRVTATFSDALGNLEVDVFRPEVQVAENANSNDGHSGSDNEIVNLQDRPAGRFYVRVTAIGDGVAPYQLSVAFTPRIFACVDDPDEPNNDFGTATDLGSSVQERQGQWICERVPADVDQFSITVPANRTRTVAASFVYGDDGDLAVEVYDTDRAQRATTLDLPRGSSKQCVILRATNVARTYQLRVRPLAINGVLDDDERLDYVLRVLDGSACDLVAPPTPGINWPIVQD